VLGTVAGAIFVGVLLNGLTMLNVPCYTQDFVKGAVLVGALALTFGIGARRQPRDPEQRRPDMKMMKAPLLAAALLYSASVAALADGIPGAPAPFDKGGVQLAFISYLSQGDYFEAYKADVARQAKALGVGLHIF
jgi:hypothetical protein